MGGITKIVAGPVSVGLIDNDRICQCHNPIKWEAVARTLWAEIVAPRQEAIDVGAYSGFYAIAAAKLGARAIAIEPLPIMARRVKDNADLNGVEIDIIEAAASYENGQAKFSINKKVPMTTGGSLRKQKLHNDEIQVSTIRLDDLSITKASAIKIDVEGAELDVLNGARELLKRDKPELIVETLSDKARADVLDLLAGEYRLAQQLDPRNLHLTPC